MRISCEVPRGACIILDIRTWIEVGHDLESAVGLIRIVRLKIEYTAAQKYSVISIKHFIEGFV